MTGSERGQSVVPAEARRDLKLQPGDKLLVFGVLLYGPWRLGVVAGWTVVAAPLTVRFFRWE